MDEAIIPVYPDSIAISIRLRPLLNPLFKGLKSGISEFTFANIFLFRNVHAYRVSNLFGPLGSFPSFPLITGMDKGDAFFMSPFGIPDKKRLYELLNAFKFMKGVAEVEAGHLKGLGFHAIEDRDNFDYLYARSDLARLEGRKFHKKKNLVNAFLGAHECVGRPLTDGHVKDALFILDEWRKETDVEGDYEAAKEALVHMEGLELCGGIYYADEKPVAYALGEELREDMFAVHFEKGLSSHKGLMQFVNQSFASILPDRYALINREQDLGVPGLRQAKESYRPSGFVKKYRITL